VDQTSDSSQGEGQSVRWMHQCYRQHDSVKYSEEIRDWVMGRTNGLWFPAEVHIFLIATIS
jgi:hypothetical protein